MYGYVVVMKDLTIRLLNHKEVFIDDENVALWREISDAERGAIILVIQANRLSDQHGLATLLLNVRCDAYAEGKKAGHKEGHRSRSRMETPLSYDGRFE